jgi:ATP-dependent protease ClpP protease subunit
MAQIEIKGEIGAQYTYKQFITDYSNAKGEMITLFVDSVGGSVTEGNQIAEFIRSHSDQFSRVINSGHVASIAASIFLALPFEKRFFDMGKGVALIHNPMAPPSDTMQTADEMISVAELLKGEQKNINSYIAKQTGADSDVIAALMQINEPLTEAQLTSINFANILKFQAVAYLNKQNDNMKKEEVEEIVAKSNQSFFDKIVALFKPEFKAIMLTDANGNQIDFPEVAEGSMPVVGDKVNAPDGEIVMASGETYVIVANVITEIKPAAADEPNVELEAIKAENEALKAQLASAQTKADEMKALEARLASFTSKMIVNEPVEAGKKIQTNRFV